LARAYIKRLVVALARITSIIGHTQITYSKPAQAHRQKQTAQNGFESQAMAMFMSKAVQSNDSIALITLPTAQFNTLQAQAA